MVLVNILLCSTVKRKTQVWIEMSMSVCMNLYFKYKHPFLTFINIWFLVTFFSIHACGIFMLCKYLSQGLILSVSTFHFEICFFKRRGRRSVDRLWVLNASFLNRNSSLSRVWHFLWAHTLRACSPLSHSAHLCQKGDFQTSWTRGLLLPSAHAASAKKLHLANFLLHNGFCSRGLKEQLGLVFSIWMSG